MLYLNHRGGLRHIDFYVCVFMYFYRNDITNKCYTLYNMLSYIDISAK